jgi:hypothetical protein
MHQRTIKWRSKTNIQLSPLQIRFVDRIVTKNTLLSAAVGASAVAEDDCIVVVVAVASKSNPTSN